jgi:hypothetical protein
MTNGVSRAVIEVLLDRASQGVRFAAMLGTRPGQLVAVADREPLAGALHLRAASSQLRGAEAIEPQAARMLDLMEELR